MLPAQRKKVDMSTMTEEEKKLFRLYGKLPTHKNVLTKVQKDRKYFDSGDYALSKAGVTPQAAVGTAIPHPENIPHVTPSPHPNIHGPALSTSPTGQTGSPIKELASANSTPAERADVPIISAPIPSSNLNPSSGAAPALIPVQPPAGQ